MDGQCHAPAALLPGMRLGSHRAEGRMGKRTCLDGCGKYFLNRNSILGPSRLQLFALPTELSRPIGIDVWILKHTDLKALRAGDADLCFYITTVQDG